MNLRTLCSTPLFSSKNSALVFLQMKRNARRRADGAIIPHETHHKVAEILDIDIPSAIKLLRQRSSIANADPTKLKRSKEILEKYKFPKGCFVTHGRLLTISPIGLESQILIFKETNMNYHNVPVLLEYKNIMTRMSVGALRKSGIIPLATDVVERYVKATGVPPEHESTIYDSIPTDTEQVLLRDLRWAVLLPFLCSVLEMDPAVAKGIPKICSKLHNRSFDWIRQNKEILTEKFNLPNDKIAKNPHLLTVRPTNLLEIAEKIPTLGGLPIQEAARKRSKILMNSANKLLQIKSLLQKYEIDENHFRSIPEFFTLSAETVEERLKDMCSDPELLPYKTNRRVSRLLYFYNRMKRRMAQMEYEDLNGLSVDIITATDKKFNRVIENNSRWRGNDILCFLQSQFPDKTSQELRLKLTQHPHWLKVALKNMQQVLSLLVDHEKLSKEQIFNVLPVVLYPHSKVEATIEFVTSGNHATKQDSYFLDMVLYFMEKECHFTGAGIWADSSIIDMDSYEDDFEKELTHDDEELVFDIEDEPEDLEDEDLHGGQDFYDCHLC